MRGEYARVALDNDDLLTGNLDSALRSGMKSCQEAFATTTGPVGFTKLPTFLNEVLRVSDSVFTSESAAARDETSYTAYKSQLEVHFRFLFIPFPISLAH